MPFDGADFKWKGRPLPDRDPWGLLNNLLHGLTLFLARAALLGVVLVCAAYAVAIATGSGPECVVHGPFQACR